jgi:hypothetical protein
MPNYQQGKIYKIVCNTTGLTYYGSTCEPTLPRRLAGHVHAYSRLKNGKLKWKCTSIRVLEKNNYVIVLVEIFPSCCKMELCQRERYYIENNECVNKKIPTRTLQELKADYRVSHKEEIAKYDAEYRKINRDKIIQRRAENYKNNIGVSKEYAIAYRQKNKEEINRKKRAYRLKQKELKSNPPLGEITE